MQVFNIKILLMVGITAVASAVIFIDFKDDTTTYQIESIENTQARASFAREVVRSEREAGQTVQRENRAENTAISRNRNSVQEVQETFASLESVIVDVSQGESALTEAAIEIIEIIPQTQIDEVTPPRNTEVPIVEVSNVINEMECNIQHLNSAFFVNPEALIVKKEQEYRAQGDIITADLLREISCFPQATWLVWKDAASMRARVEEVTSAAERIQKIPVFVIYNAPSHGSLHWWVGNQGSDYLQWIEEVAKGTGNRTAWFILEPDAIGLSTDYSEGDREYRLNELHQAVTLLKIHAPNARVYLDAGHSKWKTPEAFADLLKKAGIAEADGFALNISNYQSLENETERGEVISLLTNGKHFIIDTSRNGNGGPSDNEWCNARGRALGELPTIATGNSTIDAYFWIKPPGESDGTCNGGPTPGKFWLEYALELVENALKI